jgi:hypothetical protein
VFVSQHPFDAVHVKSIDDLTVVAVVLEALFAFVELLEFEEEGGPEDFFDAVVDVEVVDADAGLPAVEELAEEDAVDCWAYLGSLVDDDWALPPQFEDAGHQVLCGLDGHQSPRGSRPREADHVQRQSRHCLRHFHSPLDHSEVPCIAIAVRLSMCWSKSRLMTPELSAASSLGLRMTQFPAAMAAATCGMAV